MNSVPIAMTSEDERAKERRSPAFESGPQKACTQWKSGTGSRRTEVYTYQMIT